VLREAGDAISVTAVEFRLTFLRRFFIHAYTADNRLDLGLCFFYLDSFSGEFESLLLHPHSLGLGLLIDLEAHVHRSIAVGVFRACHLFKISRDVLCCCVVVLSAVLYKKRFQFFGFSNVPPLQEKSLIL
jgi:hypothetical protein